MSIVFKNRWRASNISGGTSASVSINNTAGNLLVCVMFVVNGSSSNPVNSLTDTAGNSWLIPSGYPSSNSRPAEYVGGLAAWIGYCYTSPAHTTKVTASLPSNGGWDMQVLEFSGALESGTISDDHAQAIASSLTLNPSSSGDLFIIASCTSNATSISSGWNGIFGEFSGNVAGYKITTSTSNQTMSWSPSQNGAAVGVALIQSTAATITGSATLTDNESVSAVPTIAATASLIDNENLAAIQGAFSQLKISGVPSGGTEAQGIPYQAGWAAYHWTTGTATTYDKYVALQNGELVFGPYNAASDTDLYRASAGVLKTDGELDIAGAVKALSTLDVSGILTTEDGHYVDAGASNVSGSKSAAGMPTFQVNGTNFTITATTIQACTKAYSIPANDVQVGTTYRLTFYGTATQGSTAQNMNVGVSIDGANTNQAGMAAAMIAASLGFNWKCIYEITFGTTGATASYDVTGTLLVSRVSADAVNQGVAIRSATGSLDSTVSHTIGGFGFWNSTTGAPTLTCQRSTLERLGP